MKEHESEVMKYEKVYRSVHPYGVGWNRFKAIVKMLKERDDLRLSILDVGCGRSELLRAAYVLGFEEIRGVEVVRDLVNADPYVRYGDATDLPFPDHSFETVCCMDVLEHLVRSSVPKAVGELGRVAGTRVVMSVSNVPSEHPEVGDLHVTKMSLEDWIRLIEEVMVPMGWKIRNRWDVGEGGISYFVEAVR